MGPKDMLTCKVLTVERNMESTMGEEEVFEDRALVIAEEELEDEEDTVDGNLSQTPLDCRMWRRRRSMWSPPRFTRCIS